MKKVNQLSKAELKKVLGGGLPPETPGGDPSYCASRGKGYVICIDNGGSGDGHSYFYACCSSLAEAGMFCPSGSAYGCDMPYVD
ncbi:hypothetical protein VRU48_17350 [Pedobacter sp. KR3-3]|uniref:Bacteriocin-type signal sequence-containing protein n=1 Tax=Pedobacter albus TaxID=3113905 RepID=A0ABU7IC02_9SPHI|nr:hypothetical protein [Pedobacter sp. KR3-3]MEE1946896.1 hypothetical protein [Pedobacter sp. KR3-3]